MLGKRPDRLGSGWDMLDPICSICFPCYQPIKSRSIKQVHMFSCSHESNVSMFQHYAASGEYQYRNQVLSVSVCVCVCVCLFQHVFPLFPTATRKCVCVCVCVCVFVCVCVINSLSCLNEKKWKRIWKRIWKKI